MTYPLTKRIIKYLKYRVHRIFHKFPDMEGWDVETRDKYGKTIGTSTIENGKQLWRIKKP